MPSTARARIWAAQMSPNPPARAEMAGIFGAFPTGTWVTSGVTARIRGLREQAVIVGDLDF